MHTETKLDSDSEKILQSAITAQQNDQVESALAQYQIILKKYPKHGMILHLVGIIFAQINQLDDAIKHFQRTIEVQPDHPIYLSSLGNAYRLQKKIPEAIKLFEKAISINPSLVSAHNNLALIYFTTEPNKARTLLEKAISIKPDHIDANYNLGLLLIKLNRSKAPQFLQTVIRLNAQHIGALFQLAQLYHGDKAYLKARPLYQKILNLQPDDPECLNKLGLLFLEIDQFDQGLEHLERAHKIDPNIEEIHHNLACCYLHQKKYQQALTHWLQHLKTCKDLDTFYNIGVCYLYLGRYEDCTDQLFHIIKKDPNHYKALINLGSAFLQKGQPSLACEYYARAEKIKSTPSISYILSALQQSTTPQNAPEDYIKGLFDNYAYHYDNHLCDVLDYKVPKRLKEIIDEHLNIDAHSQDILDLGCGTGLSGQAVHEYCKTLIGIDLSDNMLEQAKKKNIYKKLVQANILTKQEAYKNSMDMVISADTLPYFGNLNELFSTVKNYLITGGVWIFTIESHYGKNFQLTESARYTHSPDYVKNCTKEHGFSIIHTENHHLRTQQKTLIEGMFFVLKK